MLRFPRLPTSQNEPKKYKIYFFSEVKLFLTTEIFPVSFCVWFLCDSMIVDWTYAKLATDLAQISTYGRLILLIWMVLKFICFTLGSTKQEQINEK